MSDKSSTIFWKDGDSCHWCLRKATSITEGHDGVCPVPYAAQLEAERDDYRNQYHMAEAKVLSRDALLEQLSKEQLTQDLAKAEAENEALRELFWMTLYYWMGPEFGPMPTDKEMYNKIANTHTLLTAEDEPMSLSDVKEKYLPNRDIEDLRKKPETPISDVPITP